MAATLAQCNAVSVLRDVAATAHAQVLHKPVKVDFVVTDDAACTVSVPERLRQIARSVMNNAVHSTERGRITMILGREDQWLKLTVTDTGTGMAKEIPSALNSPASTFPRKRRGRTRPGTEPVMTGKLVELLGGSISISSRPGAGTIVEVWLPLIENRQGDVTAVPLEMSTCHA
jgi:signal transduction histidine kinase